MRQLEFVLNRRLSSTSGRRDRDSVQLSIADLAWSRATHRVVCRAVPIRQSSCSDVAGFLRCREIYSFHSLTCRWGKNWRTLDTYKFKKRSWKLSWIFWKIIYILSESFYRTTKKRTRRTRRPYAISEARPTRTNSSFFSSPLKRSLHCIGTKD